MTPCRSTTVHYYNGSPAEAGCAVLDAGAMQARSPAPDTVAKMHDTCHDLVLPHGGLQMAAPNTAGASGIRGTGNTGAVLGGIWTTTKAALSLIQ